MPDTSLQINSTLIVSIAALVFVLLERIYPYQKGQKIFRKGFFNDFFWYTIFQNYILGLIIFHFLNFIYSNTHLNELRLLLHIPVWCQLLFFLVSHDFYIYWFHRLQHRNKYLWRLHEAHHTTTDIDWLSGSRSHSLEILINQTIEFAPIVLLGAAPEVAIYKGIVSAIWGMFIHSNIDVSLGRLKFIINGPEMHRWHHSDEKGREYENNYSTKFAVWDWIYKTSFFPDPGVRKPAKYGLSDTPDFPNNYFKQNLYAFRKFIKDF